jgi:hypothetical protein
MTLWWDKIEMAHDDEIFVGAVGSCDSDEKGDSSDNQDANIVRTISAKF